MNQAEFEQKTNETGKAVVVDFWAPWCAPCRVTKPILEKLDREYAGQVEFLPVNADDSREVLEHFHVAGIPTVLALRGGEVVGRVTGAQSESGYRALFAALAEGSEVKVPMRGFDRALRLGAGGLIAVVGLSTGSWIAIGLGALIAFLGIYDRCPIWAALTRLTRVYRS
jgi:thioredoxin 1